MNILRDISTAWPARLRPSVQLLAAAVLLAGCDDSPLEPVGEVAAIVTVTSGGSPTALVQSLDVVLDAEGGVEIDYWTTDGPRLRVARTTPGAIHQVSLHRLRAGSTYDFQVTPVGPDGVLGESLGGQFSTDTLPTDTSTVGGTVWTGEAIWEWDFASDQLQKRWSSFDSMSPASDVGARSAPADWLHANSLSIGPRGNVLMSLFWTHEVISIAADYQSLEWRLGGPASTFTVLDGAMEAGQHTAVEVEADRVLLFDNGLDRPGGELFSRASELQIDRASGTAAIAWEYRPYPTTYAPIVGSTRRLENGNTVVSFGVSENALAGFPDAGPLAVHEVTPSGRTSWLLRLERVDLLHRATPLSSLGGEVEVAPR